MSFFRKLTSKEEPVSQHSAPPAGVLPVGPSLQRRFAKGVSYNLKVVIRGDRSVGKSCLLERLKGGGFSEEYVPTAEIQSACIQWNYKTSDDIVKVEVWDVVDEGRSRKSNSSASSGLKLSNDCKPEPCTEPVADARWVDVYQGCHGVILIMDMTKSWTLGYVERILPQIPETLPVLVLNNRRDMGHHRTVTEAQVRGVMADSGRAMVRYSECSLRLGFGLRYLHRWLNLPFLRLQKDTLLQQLQRNQEEMNTAVLELELEEEAEENSYEVFHQNLKKRNKQLVGGIEDPSANTDTAPPSASNGTQPTSQRSCPPPKLIPGMEKYLLELQQQQRKQTPVAQSPQPQTPPRMVRPEPMGAPSPETPDSGLQDFLREDSEVPATQSKPRVYSSTDDDEVGNPMVSAFCEEIDSSDEHADVAVISKVVHVSDEEESEPANTQPEVPKPMLPPSWLQDLPTPAPVDEVFVEPQATEESNSPEQYQALDGEDLFPKKSNKKKKKKKKRKDDPPSEALNAKTREREGEYDNELEKFLREN